MAEPGAETVLGVTYDRVDSLANILTAIDDIADHPQTARHIAFKLAQDFIADDPPAAMVDAMAAVFQRSGGDLLAVYSAMLDHPTAWDMPLRKIKTPFRFITSGLRALGMTSSEVVALTDPMIRNTIVRPLRVMGQSWERPAGPDGWPEISETWISPKVWPDGSHGPCRRRGDCYKAACQIRATLCKRPWAPSRHKTSSLPPVLPKSAKRAWGLSCPHPHSKGVKPWNVASF